LLPDSYLGTQAIHTTHHTTIHSLGTEIAEQYGPHHLQ